jgi:hypothetical protein
LISEDRPLGDRHRFQRRHAGFRELHVLFDEAILHAADPIGSPRGFASRIVPPAAASSPAIAASVAVFLKNSRLEIAAIGPLFCRRDDTLRDAATPPEEIP